MSETIYCAYINFLLFGLKLNTKTNSFLWKDGFQTKLVLWHEEDYFCSKYGIVK